MVYFKTVRIAKLSLYYPLELIILLGLTIHTPLITS